MIYSAVLPKSEMPWRRIRVAAMLIGALGLSGCATYNPLALYHRYVSHKAPPPAPGLHRAAPNLASVPAKPASVSPRLQRAVRSQLQAANRSQNALAAPAGGVAAPVVPAAPAKIAVSPPLLIGFQPERAIVSRRDRRALVALAARRGAASIAAIGFAPTRSAADLRLALLRATAIADVLTAAGVPGTAIRIEALASGHGGAALLNPPAP